MYLLFGWICLRLFFTDSFACFFHNYLNYVAWKICLKIWLCSWGNTTLLVHFGVLASSFRRCIWKPQCLCTMLAACINNRFPLLKVFGPTIFCAEICYWRVPTYCANFPARNISSVPSFQWPDTQKITVSDFSKKKRDLSGSEYRSHKERSPNFRPFDQLSTLLPWLGNVQWTLRHIQRLIRGKKKVALNQIPIGSLLKTMVFFSLGILAHRTSEDELTKS